MVFLFFISKSYDVNISIMIHELSHVYIPKEENIRGLTANSRF